MYLAQATTLCLLNFIRACWEQTSFGLKVYVSHKVNIGADHWLAFTVSFYHFGMEARALLGPINTRVWQLDLPKPWGRYGSHFKFRLRPWTWVLGYFLLDWSTGCRTISGEGLDAVSVCGHCDRWSLMLEYRFTVCMLSFLFHKDKWECFTAGRNSGHVTQESQLVSLRN